MTGNDVKTTNSHYLNQKNRIFIEDAAASWKDPDADYNIRTGLTFGTTEEETIEKQGWESRK